MDTKDYVLIGTGILLAGIMGGVMIGRHYYTPVSAEIRQLPGTQRSSLIITDRNNGRNILIESPTEKGRFVSLNSLETEILESNQEKK